MMLLDVVWGELGRARRAKFTMTERRDEFKNATWNLEPHENKISKSENLKKKNSVSTNDDREVVCGELGRPRGAKFRMEKRFGEADIVTVNSEGGEKQALI